MALDAHDRVDAAPASSRTAAAAVAIVETGIVALGLLRWIGGPVALVLHGIVVGAALVWLYRVVAARADAAPAALLAISTAVVGPLGGIGVLALDWLSRRDRTPPKRLADWYDRIALSTQIDPVSRLAEKIAIGRTVDLGAELPQSFAQVMETGTLAERQTVLGLIARRFHPEYLPALRMALGSTEPIIRVQAAAVAAHVRADLNAHVVAELERGTIAPLSPAEAVDIAGETDLALASGLVEEAERRRIEHLRNGVLADAMSALDAGATAHPVAFRRALRGDVLEAYERHLLEAGRFAEFRTLRSGLRRRMYGRFVARRGRWTRPGRAPRSTTRTRPGAA